MDKEKPAIIVVQVQPNAGENKVVRSANGAWYIRITAPAMQGKANEMLLKFLSDILGVSKGNLVIRQGMASRRKLVTIQSLTQSQVMGRLEKIAGNG